MREKVCAVPEKWNDSYVKLGDKKLLPTDNRMQREILVKT